MPAGTPCRRRLPGTPGAAARARSDRRSASWTGARCSAAWKWVPGRLPGCLPSRPPPYTHHLTRSLVGVELEIDCPDRVRLGRCRRVDGRGTNAFAAPRPRDPQALLLPEPLDLLVIDGPALTAGTVIRAPVPPSGASSRTHGASVMQRSI